MTTVLDDKRGSDVSKQLSLSRKELTLSSMPSTFTNAHYWHGAKPTMPCAFIMLGELHLIESINTLRLWQNGRHFADDISKCILLNENVWISLKISLKFVPEVPINNIPPLVQIMALCCPGNKPSHNLSLGLNELTQPLPVLSPELPC